MAKRIGWVQALRTVYLTNLMGVQRGKPSGLVDRARKIVVQRDSQAREKGWGWRGIKKLDRNKKKRERSVAC